MLRNFQKLPESLTKFAGSFNLELCILRLLRRNGFHLYDLLNLCSSHSHLQSSVFFAPPGDYASHNRAEASIFRLCAVVTRILRAECLGHLFFSTSSRPRCIAAVCWFLLWGCVLRPDDACQKRFSWCSDWIQKVQTCVHISVHLVDIEEAFEWQNRLRYSRVNYLFVPLRYLQFLKIIRSTAAAAAENEPFKVR